MKAYEQYVRNRQQNNSSNSYNKVIYINVEHSMFRSSLGHHQVYYNLWWLLNFC
jgi:hypothetical protein